MAQGAILGFGEVLLRLAPVADGRLRHADALQVVVGGAEANVLAALAGLGHDVQLRSVLPDNALGQLARAELAGRGIDLSTVGSAEGRMGLYFYEKGHGPRASAIVYDRAGSAFSRSVGEIEPGLDGVRLVHLSGVTAALSPEAAATTVRLAQAARDAGIPVSLDCNIRETLWAQWGGSPRDHLLPLVECATILFANHRDAALLCEADLPGEGEARRRAAALAFLDRFERLDVVASTARETIDARHMKLSARVDHREGAAQTHAVDITPVIDRIGTGDAFAAGVIHRWLEGKDAAAMASAGLTMAVLKHGIDGDMLGVSPGELDAAEHGASDVRR